MLSFGTVICTYNRQQLLEDCLQSWCKSRRLPDQFIVVDASKNAGEYQQELTEKFFPLFASKDSHYIVAEKPGLTAQRNIGLKLVKTDIACFADDDAFVTEDYLTKILEVFEQDKQKNIGGVNGVGVGQFDNWRQKYFRFVKNFARHQIGWIIQRIHTPKDYTKLWEPLPPELKLLPLIHIDRLWGANMNYRTELINNIGFDENFKRYGLFEDVDISVQVGKTHKLVCRLDAELTHDDSLGQSTRPKDAKYFLASWVNSAYIIEKLFPCEESRNSHRRLFQLISFLSQVGSKSFCEKRLKSFGTRQLIALAQSYISEIQTYTNQESLEKTFVRLQYEIDSLEYLPE